MSQADSKDIQFFGEFPGNSFLKMGACYLFVWSFSSENARE